MKLSITDIFLRDVYRFLEEASDLASFIGPRRTILKFLNHDNPVFKKYRKEHDSVALNKLLYYLKRHNYIQARNVRGEKAIALTKEGMTKALKASFVSSENKKRDDGKWIMLMFDIPQKQHRARTLMRSILQNLGFKMFQQSVWVTPYDISEKTEQLLQWHSLDKYVKIFLIEEI